MKMRATLKLDNAGATHNAVVGKSISSSRRSNPLTVVSFLEAPDHKNVKAAIAISTNLELFSQGRKKWQLNDPMMRLSSGRAREENPSRWF
jgi:hypothetical protein